MNGWTDHGIDPDARMASPLSSILARLRLTSMQSDWTPSDRLAKATEELGEIGTAILIMQGKLTHKTLDEPLEGEVADLIICVLDVLFSMRQGVSTNTLEDRLLDALDRKAKKWQAIVLENAKVAARACSAQAAGNGYD